MKIWNSVEGYARNPPDKSLEGIFCTAKKGGKSELSSYAFLLLLLRQTKGAKKNCNAQFADISIVTNKKEKCSFCIFCKGWKMVGQQIVHNTFSFGVYEALSRSLQRGVKGWLLDPLRGRPMCAFDRTPGHKSQQMASGSSTPFLLAWESDLIHGLLLYIQKYILNYWDWEWIADL